VTQEPPQDHPIVVKLFGRSGSAAAYAIRDFLQRSDVPFDFYHRARNTQSQGRISILSDSNYGVVLRGGIRHLVRTRVTHQFRNQLVDDHVRAGELGAVGAIGRRGARSTRRSLSGRI